MAEVALDELVGEVLVLHVPNAQAARPYGCITAGYRRDARRG